MLYLGGALARASRLVALLDAARRASKKALHTTLIRNEVRSSHVVGIKRTVLDELQLEEHNNFKFIIKLSTILVKHSCLISWHRQGPRVRDICASRAL